MSRRYQDAAAKLQQSVQKHLKEAPDLSSSEDDEPLAGSILEDTLRRYRDGSDTRLRAFLEEAITGRSTCLICISSVRREHPIWSCDHCFSHFHLSCIQKWANDSLSLRENDTTPVAVVRPPKIEWCCPKCRTSYNKDEVPQKYRCFCTKLSDPPFHPWLIPHSCGEVCQKRLSLEQGCKHICMLLCHPKQCPPCAQTVNAPCYCGDETKKLRCSSSKWSCGKTCKHLLSCNSHKCEEVCHDGACPQCSYTSLQTCECGREQQKRPCNDAKWQCNKVCSSPYSCGYHNCEKVCHFGECGSCPNSGTRSCPCGANQRYVQCPDIMETCMGTCGKNHDECSHNCPEKCHRGPCPPCQVLVEKNCHCGTHTRPMPCSRDFKCDTKCRGIRPCNKHNCGRKCCNGNCPPCEKVCDKPLQCGRHKCTMVCHSGPCYPCTRESKIVCRCKQTCILVVCGREKHTKPPKCCLLCKLKYKCGHTEENQHTCHFGDCPPCEAFCKKQYKTCSHECISKCHKAVAVVFQQVDKPATPWEVQPPKTKIMALDCPPCTAKVMVQCYGRHETVSQVCHEAQKRPCGRECGRALDCGNHLCAMLCHLYTRDPKYPNVPSECEQCVKECEVPRPANCTHKCSLQNCHPGECPRCDILQKIKCHCGLTDKYIRCHQLAKVTEEMLSCNQQCPKNLECGHRCKNLCHSGDCKGQECTKKLKTYCDCGNIRKELACNLVRSGNAKVACDDSCEVKKQAAQIEKEKEEKRQKELEEEKNKRELEEYAWKFGKKKKHKEKKVRVLKDDRSLFNKFWMYIISVLVLTIAVISYMVLN